MNEKKEYRVVITETLQKVVIVKAETEQEAHRRAEDAWKNAEITLCAEDFQGAEFHVLKPLEGSEADKGVRRLEEKDV